MTHPLRTAHRRAGALLGGASIVLVCAAPAAAQINWTDLFMDEQKERQIAEQEHPKILEQFGGAYQDPALQAYLDGLIQHLGRNSHRPDIAYRVTILNSPIVNAFALPAGYLYVSRGLLSLAGNEAEVAGVLAHEIGHVTARHTAERYGRGVLASGGIGLIGMLGAIFDSPQLAQTLQQAVGVGATLYIRGFSREQELEADRFGVEIMGRAGYDPHAMSSFLTRLQRDTRLRATLIGKPGEADQFSLLSTHPRTEERVGQAIRLANIARGGRVVRVAEYLDRIDGLMYGDDPAQGFVRGTRFVHPKLKIRFRVPAAYRLVNSTHAVTAFGPEHAIIRFDAAPRPFAGAMQRYLTQEWIKDQPLQHLETLDINGLEAATGATRLQPTPGGAEVDVRLVAIRFDEQSIYRFVFATPPKLTKSLEMGLRGTTYSFRRISDEEAAGYQPHQLKILRVKPGDTVAGLAARMPYPDYQVERFAAVNGLDPAQPLKPGQLVKIIVEGS
ncbi:MAG: M48 family metalloprotease [Kiloniellales bacterium]